MNAFLLVTVVALVTINVSGQGQIFFNNRVVGVVVEPVYGANPSNPTVRLSGNATTNGGTVNYAGYPLISGTGWTAQLWYGPEGSPMNALQPVTSTAGTVPFRSLATTAGFIQPSAAAATLNGIPFGERATLQMRVWDNRGGTITSWAAVISDPTGVMGFSDVFTSPVLVAPPNTPPYMVGLTSFNVALIPEPSVLSLSVIALGLAALRLRHRRTARSASNPKSEAVMKALIPIVAFAFVTINASGQGQIFFNNRVIGQVVAPVYGIHPAAGGLYRVSGNATTNGGIVDYTGFPLVSGTNFTAQLWYGPVASSMDALQPVTSPAGTVPFRSTANTGGFIQNSADAVVLNGIPFGSRATLQMRVWYNHGGTITSWAQAISSAQFGSQYAFGFSDTFTSPVLIAPANIPPYMVGLVSFNLQGTLVPEPSVIALTALGLSALVLRPRRN